MSVINTNNNIALSLTFVEINGQDISNYLASGSKVSWYDVSKDSGRNTTNANGDMILNVINDKYRLDLITRPLTDEEVVTFFREIRKKPTMSVKFLDPFTNTLITKKMYRGDRSAEWLQPHGGSILFQAISQALIEV